VCTGSPASVSSGIKQSVILTQNMNEHKDACTLWEKLVALCSHQTLKLVCVTCLYAKNAHSGF
jgi:hypothetical protein